MHRLSFRATAWINNSLDHSNRQFLEIFDLNLAHMNRFMLSADTQLNLTNVVQLGTILSEKQALLSLVCVNSLKNLCPLGLVSAFRASLKFESCTIFGSASGVTPAH